VVKRAIFKNRQEAGRKLARRLIAYRNNKPIILALPRGGVGVGYEIARVLHAKLDVIISRKIGAPYNPEFGIGAVSEKDTVVLDRQTINKFGYAEKDIHKEQQQAQKELERRLLLYRGNHQLPNLFGKTVIVVDDGLATGVTALAAIKAIKKDKPEQLIFAVPVCASETGTTIQSLVDTFICLASRNLWAIGLYYEDFKQVSDEEVLHLLSLNQKQMVQDTK